MRQCRQHNTSHLTFNVEADPSPASVCRVPVSLGAAFAILFLSGLPDRLDYSGLHRRLAVLYLAPEVGAPGAVIRPSDKSLPGCSRLIRYSESIIIINFWATWCQPCRRELRDLQNLYDHYPGQARIIAVNLGEKLDDVRNWLLPLGLTYDLLLDPDAAVSRLYQIRGLPTTYVLDSEHRVRRLYFGFLRLEQLRRDLDRFGGRA